MLSLGLVMLLGMPWFLNQRPVRHDPLVVRRAYAKKMLYYWGTLLGCLVGAGAGSILIVREARRTYRAAAIDNMKLLVEGSLNDQISHDTEKSS